MNSTGTSTRFGRNPGWVVTGIVAVVYGLGVSFLGDALGPRGAHLWLIWGSALVGILFLVFMVVPFLLWLVRRPAVGDPRRK